MGATGRSLAGKLITESLVIAVLGAGVGIGLAYLGVGVLSTRVPQAFSVPRLDAVQVDGTVLLIAVAVTVLTGVLFGLVPALQATVTSPASTLGAESRGPSRRTGRLRNGLVVAEVALSVVLLGGAALMGRSLGALMEVDPGFRPEQVLVGRVNLSSTEYRGDESKAQFFQELLDRLEDKPGIRTVGGVTFLPMDGLGAATSYFPMDRPTPEPEDMPAADIRNVAGDYFQAMGIALLDGRGFDTRDGPDGPRSVVVNRTLAELNWPGESAVGKPVYISWETEEPWEIVGVVEDVRMAALAEEPREAIYLNYLRAPYFNFMHIVARGTGDPAHLVPAVRSELQAMDPTLPLGRVRVMEDLVANSAARPRMTAFLMVLFAGIATLLAAVGLYGVLAYAVSRRVREIGIRMAVGAGSREILRMVIRQGGVLAVLGLSLGLGLALAGGRVVASLLYQVRPTDPIALGGAGLLLLAVALAATVFPAWRASRVPPVEALRND
jgi:predicted permease